MNEYDAGYENCIDSMVRQMEDMQFRIDNLQRENAELREQVARHKKIDAALAAAEKDLSIIEGRYGINLTNAELYMLCDAVYAINTKLREFAKNAYKHICLQEGYLRGSGYDSFDYFDTMARELGIEVEI